MKYFASAALLPEGWTRDVVMDIDTAGRLVEVTPGESAEGCEILSGPVVPAMPNLHSHAFQRAIAGRTGRAAADEGDSVWTWRQAMYAFLERVDAEAVESIAAQAYIEMAKAGYGAVAEFHYVHHDAAGTPYGDPAELAWRIVAAADTAGLELTLLPVFYAHAGFGGTPPTAGQRRFVHNVYTYTHLVDRLREREEEHGYVLGVAPHSLRAVTPEELGRVVRLASPTAPVHIHAAEQTKEVDDCFAWSRLRPIEWLLTQASVDRRWCIVHATHMLDREVTALAASGAVAGLAPTTEADLGDGTFPGSAYLAARGAFGLGSDSNTIISPFAELRQLEWSQRMRARRRNVLAGDDGQSLGTALWTRAARGGAQATGRNMGALSKGKRADLLVLNMQDPALMEQDVEDVLDAAIFGPAVQPVRDVMVRGRLIVRDGQHVHQERVLADYRATLARMAAS